ncbi:MAG: sensor histidine kinase [Cellulosilyticaceae bacterium]
MKKSIEVRKIIGKVSLILGAIYVGMMGLFTWIQRENCIDSYEGRTVRLHETVENIFTSEMQVYEQQQGENGAYITYEDTLAEIATSIRFRINSMSNEAFYTKVAFFDTEGNEMLKPGNILSVTEGPLGKIKATGMTRGSKERFIDLDKYMTQAEMIDFFELTHEMIRVSAYDLAISGYVVDEEVIPEKIEVYKEQTEETIKVYAFEVSGKEKLESIEADFALDYFESVPRLGQDVNDFKSYIMNEKTIERYASCEARLDTAGDDVKVDGGIRILQGNTTWDKVEVGITRPIIVAGKTYYMSIASAFYPYEIILPTLLTIYGFALIVVVVLGIILIKGLVEVYEQQQLIEKSRRQLIDAIGHELKTPLGIIRTYSEMIKANVVAEKRDYYADVVMDEVDKMDALILEMLDLSKLESKAYVLKEEVFDLEQAVQSIVKEKKALFEAKEAVVHIVCDEATSIQGDYKRMQQVIGNLLDNAVTHIPQNGKIEIKLEDGRLSIANNGPPIDDEVMLHLWDAFYKGKRNETSEIIRGTGLGLAIVKHLLELHGMAYGFRNTEVGVLFWIDFSSRKIIMQQGPVTK